MVSIIFFSVSFIVFLFLETRIWFVHFIVDDGDDGANDEDTPAQNNLDLSNFNFDNINYNFDDIDNIVDEDADIF